MSATTPLVIVEGNYLLVDQEPWVHVRDLLAECWYVDAEQDLRLEHLIARHVEFGRSPDDARLFATTSDQHNADVMSRTKQRADLVVCLALE